MILKDNDFEDEIFFFKKKIYNFNLIKYLSFWIKMLNCLENGNSKLEQKSILRGRSLTFGWTHMDHAYFYNKIKWIKKYNNA